jgi:c-di-AMP phosphodiesterase-like protein
MDVEAMKKKFLKILNRYSLIYLPVGWVAGLAIFFIAFEPISALYFLSFGVIVIFYVLIFYTSNRKMVDDSYRISDYKYSIIEFYSDY